MKKKKLIKTPSLASLFPSKEKDILAIVNDPKKMQAVLELGRAASNLQENLTNSSSLQEWAEKVLLILPSNMNDKEDFAIKFMEFVNGYRSESKRNDSTDCK